ncbi:MULTISPECIES: TetR/AcrR family transcriptional regulator [Nocardioides]|uniref:TetR/AcrR family transcriptional regulator n=1 Tax=Nocardioides vastitatis TaxID=2568655 RepID=A0ABW0ZJ31_9ACTN|nr:TetR/AcrR family transcriptional regulator [Nocardioides sp.]THI95679.1 TetR/AcrR family transcriptional regulator [Nocardioides sp.]
MTTATRSHRIRLAPDQRRSQLLDLGVRLLATRSLDELSIDVLAEEAGISRGLLYHYFGGKQGFYEAVVQHAADDLFAQTAPPAGGEPLQRLHTSITAYVDYVQANHAGYRSLVKAAGGGNEALRAIYETTFEAMADRVFAQPDDAIIPDTPATRLLVRAWQSMVEDLVLSWCADPTPLTREELLHVITTSLPALVDTLP